MDEAARKTLLKTARKAVEASVRGESPPMLPDDRLAGIPFTGIFVTVKNQGRLRGCIGTFRPLGDILQTVSEMAVSSARDPRFVGMPIRPEELRQLTIEVSVLGELRRTDNPLSLKLGVDGVYIRRGGRAGCFLPQVATEQGWTSEQFLDRCCEGKAGLPAGSWKEPGTEVYLFTTEVFGEGDGLEDVSA